MEISRKKVEISKETGIVKQVCKFFCAICFLSHVINRKKLYWNLQMLVQMQYFQLHLHLNKVSFSCWKPHLPLWTFLLYCLLNILSRVYLKVKCIYNGTRICISATKYLYEDKTMSNTFSPLVGSSTCWERKLFCIKTKYIWSWL